MKARRSNSRHLVLTLALAFSFTCLATAADQPTPRSLIELGITAQGGMKNLEMIGARYSTAKGYWYEAGDATLRTVTYL
ncbi:hypothetical protein BH10PLA2_BH10PLA2_22630 [soil metagenome]